MKMYLLNKPLCRTKDRYFAIPGGDFDMRQLGSGPRGPPMPQGNDQDMRLPPPNMTGPPTGPPGPPVPPPPTHDNYGGPPHPDFDNRYCQITVLCIIFYISCTCS